MKTVAWLGVAIAAAGFAGTASAATSIVDQSSTRYVACYGKVYVPAKIAVATHRRAVRQYARTRAVSRGTCSGGWCEHWAAMRNPSPYRQTYRVVEPAHYVLVTSPCM